MSIFIHLGIHKSTQFYNLLDKHHANVFLALFSFTLNILKDFVLVFVLYHPEIKE